MRKKNKTDRPREDKFKSNNKTTSETTTDV